MYKSSKFNFVYKRNDEYVIFNTFSKSMATLDEKSHKGLKDNEFDVFNDDEISALLENGFIIEDNFDEIEFLRYYNQKVRFRGDYYCLTIAPTLECNFDCPYCFENKRPGKMTNKVQDDIVKYVCEKIDLGIKTIEITWYGGEPLLCFDIIQNMSNRIVEYANNKNCICKMGMITNGYLLNSTIVDYLEKYDVSVQITLDGLSENHDKRRYLKNGNGTFDKIFDNLKLFINKKINVYIRMNVDNYNRDDYEKLSILLDEMKNERMILYPAVVEKINERKGERESYYMNDSRYDDFISITRKNGLFKYKSSELPISNDVSTVPENRCYFCAAELDLSDVIDEKGNVYKCWDEVGYQEYCFNVSNPTKINYDVMFRYIGDHTFNDPKCSKCVFLPLCFGGCKFHRCHLERYACAFTEDSVISYIEDTFFNKNL